MNETNRRFYARLHSAGHLLDIAVKKLGIAWKPGKGYHFSDGPYVEYSGSSENMNLNDIGKSI